MRAIIFVLLLFCSTPVWAAICDQFPKTLSQSQAEDLTGKVKDGFPAKYRAELDRVTISVSPQSNLELDVATIGAGKRNELTISAGYAHNLCVLMAATVPLGSDPPPVTDRFVFPATACSKGQERFSCLIQYLDGLNARRESSGEAAAVLSVWSVSIRATLRTALLYGLAHEYGHVVASIDPNLIPFQDKIDPEFVADIAGLYVITSKIASPVADGLYFGGLRVVDLAHLSDAASSGSHEPTICRAMRTNEIRKQLLPSLVKIYAWLNSGPREDFFGKDAAEGTIIQFAFADTSGAGCVDRLPAAAGAVVDDLQRLGGTLAAYPNSEKLTPGQIDQLETLPVNTGFGRSLRSSLVMEAKFARPDVIRVMSDDVASAKVAFIGPILNDPQSRDIASEGYSMIISGWAAGRFIDHPRG